MSQTKLDSDIIQNTISDYQSITLSSKGKVQILSIENLQASCKVSLFGGHVLSFVSNIDNRERLWLSEEAVFDGVKAIRGGIPICWPWFSAHPTDATFPSHGYARTQNWDIEVISEDLDASGQVTSTRVKLVPQQTSLFGYEHIHVKLVINVASELTLDLTTHNASSMPLTLTQALHSYFKVQAIDDIEVLNIFEPYSDKPTLTDNNPVNVPYVIKGEVDRIHVIQELVDNKEVTIKSIQDNMLTQKIEMSGIDSVVVWNPGQKLGNSMSDIQLSGYNTMLCVEAANTEKATAPLVLNPNQSHSIKQKIF